MSQKDMSKNINNDAPWKCDPRGLGAIIFDKMKEYEDIIGQIEAETGKKETHGEMRMRSIRVAQEMQSRNITSEDIISICSDNNMDCYIPVIAAFFLGIKVAPLDPMLPIQECTHIINLVRPKLMFCGTESVDLMKESIQKSDLNVDIVVFGETTEYIPFADFLKSKGTEDNFQPKIVDDQHDTAIIHFTSGTTGLPKGICVTHYGLLCQIANGPFPISVLSFTRLYWISGTLLLLYCILNKSCRLLAKFEYKTIFKYIYEYKVNVLFISQYITYKLTDHLEYNTYDMSCLWLLHSAGGTIAKSQILKLRNVFPNIHILVSYGLTEVTGSGTRFIPGVDTELILKNPTSCGRAYDIQYKVVDLETNEIVGSNQHGELYIKSPAVMNGYYKDPEATAKVFDDDGYLKTGDIVYFDEDGCFFVVDRINDMMKYQAWKVAPQELEEILLQHPDVREAVVISQPNDIDGDLPVGIVVLKEESKCTEEDLIKLVNEKVPDYKKLRGGVRFVSEMPVTPTGKFKKRALRQLLMENKL